MLFDPQDEFREIRKFRKSGFVQFREIREIRPGKNMFYRIRSAQYLRISEIGTFSDIFSGNVTITKKCKKCKKRKNAKKRPEKPQILGVLSKNRIVGNIEKVSKMTPKIPCTSVHFSEIPRGHFRGFQDFQLRIR
jgi:hypothetical protein